MASVLEQLMAAGGLDPRITEDTWRGFVEHVAETLDVGPGTRVFDVGCRAGAFLLPLAENGYVVGGLEASPALVERARLAMPGSRWEIGEPSALDPGEAWDVVLSSAAFAGFANLDHARGVLARMAAKATHAVAVLAVPEREQGGLYDRAWILRVLSETGARAVQFEDYDLGPGPEVLFNVFARV
jgi:trans-aconitate methyltransferase